MSIFGDSKEEDREIFAAMKAETREMRQRRAAEANMFISKVKSLCDGRTFCIDLNGTWNMKLKGRSVQYWPTKGRWQYTSQALLARAQAIQRQKKTRHYSYNTQATQFGGGIHAFIVWLEKEQ